MKIRIKFYEVIAKTFKVSTLSEEVFVEYNKVAQTILEKRDEIADSILNKEIIAEIYVNKGNMKEVMKQLRFISMESKIRFNFVEEK